MQIVAIEQPTDVDRQRLVELKSIEKTRPLTDDETSEYVFLSVKECWNCEC
jgi:hypothetical protein